MKANVSTGLFVGGGALVAGAVAMMWFLTAPDDTVEDAVAISVLPEIGNGRIGLQLVGSF